MQRWMQRRTLSRPADHARSPIPVPSAGRLTAIFCSACCCGNLFANCGQLLMRTEAVDAGGGFAPGIAYGEDWEFCIRIALQGSFASAPGNDPVLFVRRHAEGAYRRLAQSPDAFAPCMNAIFSNPA